MDKAEKVFEKHAGFSTKVTELYDKAVSGIKNLSNSKTVGKAKETYNRIINKPNYKELYQKALGTNKKKVMVGTGAGLAAGYLVGSKLKKEDTQVEQV